jgi:predicted MFS family arabinose efflux permease
VVATLVAGLIVSKGVNRANFIVCVLALSMSNLVLFVHASFHALLLLRLVMGIAQGAIIPVVFSMAADMYSPVDRPSASAILTGAVGAGAFRDILLHFDHL